MGGPAYGGVTDSVFQEVDVKTGLVMYEWTSSTTWRWRESYEPASRSSAADPFDFFHLNSISVDSDGSLLISSRNTWTVYKLGQQSGQIVWRLGGKHSSFKMGPATGTAWQHDPREPPNGSFSIFDNGSSPKAHDQSRAVVESVNPQSGTVTLVDRLTHTPPLLVESQGNVQALAGGDWFVGGARNRSSPSSGPKENWCSTRTSRCTTSPIEPFASGTGTPAHPPAFAFAPAGAAGGTVYASWNGATEVASWRLLAGASASSLSTIAQVPRSGFETAIPLPAGTAGPYLAVQALSAAGQVLGTSATVAETGL